MASNNNRNTGATAEAGNGDGQDGEDLFIIFTHRELPPAVLVAMGLFNNSAFSGVGNVNAKILGEHINYGSMWRSSRMVPFLGNISVERLQCTGSAGFADGDDYRVLVNNAPQDLGDCADGPGTSCSWSG